VYAEEKNSARNSLLHRRRQLGQRRFCALRRKPKQTDAKRPPPAADDKKQYRELIRAYGLLYDTDYLSDRRTDYI